jgi:hypothetical protein
VELSREGELGTVVDLDLAYCGVAIELELEATNLIIFNGLLAVSISNASLCRSQVGIFLYLEERQI